MVRIDAVYAGDLRCEAVHIPSGSRLSTDAPRDNHGKGETFSPTDLVATGLVTCMATVMGLRARRDGWALEGMTFQVEKHMTSAAPRRIARLEVAVTCPQNGLDQAARSELEAIAHNCPVRLSLLPAIDVPVRFDWG